MPINDCLGRMVQAGVIRSNQVARLQKEATYIKNKLEADPKFTGDAVEEASMRAVVDMRNRLAEQRRAVAIQAEIDAQLTDYISKAENPVVATRELLRNVDFDSKAIQGLLTNNLVDFVESARSKYPRAIDYFMKDNKMLMDDVIRALWGENSSAVAKAFAKEINASRQKGLDRLSRAGIKLNLMDGFDITHRWGATNFLALGRQQSVRFLKPLLNRDKMLNEQGLKMTDEELDTYLGKAYDDITRQEKSKFRAGGIGGTASKNLHRKLHFKSADDFLAAYKKLGSGDLFSTIMGEFQDMASDIAMVERFGPSPRSTYSKLSAINNAYKEQKSTIKTALNAAAMENFLVNNDNVFEVLMGSMYGNGSQSLANLSAASRSLQTAGSLGMAVISSIGDAASMKVMSEMWGMSFARTFGNVLRNIVDLKNSEKGRRLAGRLAQVMDWAYGPSQALSRHTDMVVTGAFSKFANDLGDFVVRSTGLAKIQRENEQQFALSLMGYLSDLSNNNWDQLNKKVQTQLLDGGIDAKTWDKIRVAKSNIDNIEWIDPSQMADTVATKYLSMVYKNVRQAIYAPNVETRAIMTGGAAQGTLERELRAFSTQFLGFPLSAAMTSLRVLLFNPGNNGILGKASFASRLTLYTMLTSSIAIDLKDIASGKNLQDHMSPDYWARAAYQGGVFGTGFAPQLNVQDFKNADYGQVAYGWLPPGIQPIADFTAVSKQSIAALIEGDTQKAIKKAGTFVNDARILDTFYTRLINQRLIKDQLQKMIDPEASSAFKRSQERLSERTGQDFWWKPGATSPFKE